MLRVEEEYKTANCEFFGTGWRFNWSPSFAH